MEAWSRLQKRTPGLQVVFAVEQLSEAGRKACAEGTTELPVFLDPEGRTARRFNALWRPRVYVLDESGRIAYVQPDTTLDSGALAEVRRL